MLNSLDSDGTWGTFHGRGVSRYRADKIYPGHHPERDHPTDSFLLLKKKSAKFTMHDDYLEIFH